MLKRIYRLSPSLFFCALFTISAALSKAKTSVRFAPSVRYSADLGSYDLATGDFNGDGHLDLAVANIGDINSSNGSVSVLLGKGDGTFPTTLTHQMIHKPELIAAADLNGDGRLDLVVTNRLPVQNTDSSAKRTLTVLFGNGDGAFSNLTDYIMPTNYPSALLLRDINGDNEADLIITDNVSAYVYINRGDGSFGNPLITSFMPYKPSVHDFSDWRMADIADFNGDGKPDLAVTTSIMIIILLGNGDGTFTIGNDYQPKNPSNLSFVTINDFNGDGKVDVMTSSGLTDGVMQMFYGTGDGTFSISPRIPYNENSEDANLQPFSALTEDDDSDGFPDLFVLNDVYNPLTGLQDSHASFFLNDGGGYFRISSVQDIDPDVSEAISGDFNEDGRPDIATVRYEVNDTNNVDVYINRSKTSEENLWGKIANSDHLGESIYTALFFAGPPNPNSLSLYTRHPKDGRLNGWTDDDIDFALSQMTDAGINAIKLSYWGYQGETDKWSPTWLFSQTRWPGDTGNGNYTEAEQVASGRHFFEKAISHHLSIAPMLEISPSFTFDKINDQYLIMRAVWLLKNLGDESNWLQLYDHNGQPRQVIWLIGYPVHDPSLSNYESDEFDNAAQEIESETGRKVGFVVDPISLYSYDSGAEAVPILLARFSSILAVNSFMPSMQGINYYADDKAIPEAERLTRTEEIFKQWANAGVPFIPSVTLGYDASIVFPTSGAYGFTPAWRDSETRMALLYSTDGASFDTWNGWTEGYAIPPSEEEGDTNFRWASGLVSALKTRESASESVPGDLNGDRTVNILDATLSLKMIIGILKPDDIQILAGDVRPINNLAVRHYGDGSIRVNDVNWILQRALGIAPPLY